MVYPSLSSLVSGTVEPESNGEALGAINGVKALTEGIGPLIFGTLMTISEDSDLPGWPYWIACILVLFAYKVSKDLPNDSVFLDDNEQDKGGKEFIYELQFKQQRRQQPQGTSCLSFTTPTRQEDEYKGLLLSEIEEESSASESNYDSSSSAALQREASLVLQSPPTKNDSSNSSRREERLERLWAKMDKLNNSLTDLREDFSPSNRTADDDKLEMSSARYPPASAIPGTTTPMILFPPSSESQNDGKTKGKN